MNFKKYHVSKNLFDKDNTNIVNAYFENNDNWRSNAESSSVVIPVEPNTEYTLSVQNSLSIFRINETSSDNPVPDSSIAFTRIVRGTNIAFYTFTTLSTTKNIVFQGTYADTQMWFNSLMLNEGSTPLPYEPYGNTWTDIPHYIHTTSTDTIATLPTDLYADGNNATVGLVGNMKQTGTPTPTTPIQPQETGEMTGNLFDGALVGGAFKDNEFNIATSSSTTVFKSIKIFLSAGTYTFSWGKNVNVIRLVIDDVYSQIGGSSDIASYTITSTTDNYVGISFRDTTSSSTDWDMSTPIMLNTGSTALQYEPYGYKIPILNDSTTTPVYLGEVQSTRQIKKVVLTGQEDWSRNTTAVSGISLFVLPITDALADIAPVCTHYVGSDVHIWRELHTNEITVSIISGSTQRMVVNMGDVYTETEDFKTYLQQQYAAGTPVTVWYVLATETTGIVNEPLRKIGDYADTVSGITIPVIAGTNTLTVDTTLQPSEVTVNYKGWHLATSVKNYIHNGIDIITTLPVTISADGNAFVGLQGDLTQTGTPTPTNPIQPQECGERTGNLWDKDTAPSLKLYINTRDAIIKTNPDTRLTYYPCKADTTYTVIKTAGTRFALATTVNTPVANEPLLNSIMDNTADVLSITTPSTAVYLVVWYWINTDTITEEQMRDSIMIVESSTAPSNYEPYGYKIPISSGGNNLFDASQISWENAIKNDDGEDTASTVSHYTTNFTEVKSETTYCLGGNLGSQGQAHRIYFYDKNKTWLSRSNTLAYNVPTFTTPINCKYVQFQVQQFISGNDWMLVEGSTPLPYEPYSRTITPVYLGEAQTTRKIKKLVLTGQEGFTKTSSADYTYYRSYENLGIDAPIERSNAFCSHFAIETALSRITHGQFILAQNGMYFRNDSCANAGEFNTWLAAQYAADTPVTVWYVLATETTGIVNEPLRKIGDYADTVNNISIPTIVGEDIIDVETTLKPSKMKIKYNSWRDGNISYLLADNPLCGIDTYKDTLNLANGSCTRQIKKLVLTGEETTGATGGALRFNVEGYLRLANYTICMCSHYSAVANVSSATNLQNDTVTFLVSGSGSNYMYLKDARFINTPDVFKTYLQQQYAAGTPVTVWYVLAEPTTETITVPTGLFGTEEGYLNQSSTPTPTNPIYPTANEVPMWN